MRTLQVLVPRWLEGQTRTATDAGRLLGSDSESFRIDSMSLTIEVEDIYFITGLSRRGEMVNLHARGGPSHGLTIDEYIAVYCYPETEKVGS